MVQAYSVALHEVCDSLHILLRKMFVRPPGGLLRRGQQRSCCGALPRRLQTSPGKASPCTHPAGSCSPQGRSRRIGRRQLSCRAYTVSQRQGASGCICLRQISTGKHAPFDVSSAPDPRNLIIVEFVTIGFAKKLYKKTANLTNPEK